ncbi:unnamed protein product [Cochlearia groenlandica]
MSVNRDEALRAKELAEGLMKKTDFTGARKLATKAQNMDPGLENLSQMLMVCVVHCAAKENLFGNEMDWYGILQVEMNANDTIIKKQYKRLALLLHPDKNKLPGAEAAFKLIGEAQRTLLDNGKRSNHDMKRKTWRKPAPAPSYKTPHMPNDYTKKASFNMRTVFNESRPENRHPQQKSKAQPAAFSHCPTLWAYCTICRMSSGYHREHINKEVTCRNCNKKFIAVVTPFQSVPLAKSSCQTTSSFPQQNKIPGKEACNESHKRPDDPATAFSRKASFPMSGSTAENKKRKRKRKNTSESSESSDSESSSESENDDSVAAQDSGSNGGQKPRRSDRSKQQVSYNENLSEDEAELVIDKGEGSQKNIDTEREDELEDEKQTHDDDHSAETLPNGIHSKEKIKVDQMESSDGASDSEEDLSSGREAKSAFIDYDDPDFSDFDDKFRGKNLFKPGQIWALYDEEDGVPRFYAVIKKVKTQYFSVKYTWLEAEEDEENETRKLPVSVGKFELGEEQKGNSCSIFSHLMYEKTRSRVHFKIFPKKGQKWALFKNWNFYLSSESDSPREYEFVEIMSDHAEGRSISVGLLSKVEGFSCVFCPMPKEDGSNTCEIPPDEFCRFSHSIPFVRLTGTEGEGVTEGWYELDPAALPVTGSQIPSGEEAAPDQDQHHQSPPSGPAC